MLLYNFAGEEREGVRKSLSTRYRGSEAVEAGLRPAVGPASPELQFPEGLASPGGKRGRGRKGAGERASGGGGGSGWLAGCRRCRGPTRRSTTLALRSSGRGELAPPPAGPARVGM